MTLGFDVAEAMPACLRWTMLSVPQRWRQQCVFASLAMSHHDMALDRRVASGGLLLQPGMLGMPC